MSLLLLFNPQQANTNPGLGLLLRPGPARSAASIFIAPHTPAAPVDTNVYAYLFGTATSMGKGRAGMSASAAMAARATGQAKGRATQGDTASLSGRAAGMGKGRAGMSATAAMAARATGQGKGKATQGDKASIAGRATGMAKGRAALSGVTPPVTGTTQPTLFISNTGRFLSRKGS